MSESRIRAFRALNRPCVLLIAIAGMERFVFKGVASNLVIYLTDVMEMSNSAAARTVSNWGGFTSMVPLLVAPLVDSYWDRYSTIITSGFIYLLGLLALTSTTLNRENSSSSSSSSSSMYWSLYLISLGQGGFNPSLQAFGAVQIDTDDDDLPTTTTTKNDDKGPTKKSLFFQWWYFGICSGSLLGVSIMPNVQDSVGWGLGFAVPAVAMAVSIVLFTCGSRFYNYAHEKEDVDGGGPFERIVRTIKYSVSRIVGSKTNEKSSRLELELEEQTHRLKDKTDETESLTDQAPDNDTNKNNTTKSNQFLEIVKVVLRLLPIWTTLLMFAVIFQQPATFFIKQGAAMRRNIGPTYKIPPATLQSAINVSIILLMPFYDTLFVPFTRRLLRNDRGVTTMQRIGVGMLLSVAAMAAAAAVEARRLSAAGLISIFWLLPQYVLLGVSDVFTVVGMQEFFYGEVPPGMQTMGIALNTSVFGVGRFLSALLVYLVERCTTAADGSGNWFADDMAAARLDKYYWLLAATGAVSLGVFVALCKCHKTSS